MDPTVMSPFSINPLKFVLSVMAPVMSSLILMLSLLDQINIHMRLQQYIIKAQMIYRVIFLSHIKMFRILPLVKVFVISILIVILLHGHLMAYVIHIQMRRRNQIQHLYYHLVKDRLKLCFHQYTLFRIITLLAVIYCLNRI
eukprot:Pompholyxophrys_sp_v1_NODE_4_length_15125_cov_6.573656.p11 type:complete len:142 gc:universal NODE_4_length_15125_cov_6.573656:4256-4681(+)